MKKLNFLNSFFVSVLFIFMIIFSVFISGILYGYQENNNISILITGDALISLPLSNHSEPEFMKLINEIRNADVAITNLEMLIHTYKGYPQAESGGTYMAAEPEIARELVWAGFDMVGCANNHTYDYGLMGILETTMYLREAGLVYAGVGMDLQQARKPGYLLTEKGKVALFSCASTFVSFGKAGRSRPDLHGRPGLNPLTVTPEYTIDSTTAVKFQNLARECKLPSGVISRGKFRFFGRNFTIGEKYSRSYKINERDLMEILESIRKTKENSDWIVMSVHAHQGGNNVPDFLVNFAHLCIDNGVDLVFSHGPHFLKGIEIYKGRPIFYSLGNFIFQNETIKKLPSEFYERYGLGDSATPEDAFNARTKNDTRGWPTRPEYWESVVATVYFQDGILKKIRLLPISLGFGKPRGIRGRPVVAGPELGKKIIEKLKLLSEPFNTNIVYTDGLGVINVNR